ncbi:hypothetical protein QJQ45_028336 [Haematococcus lacustris]|nr:hypothetical protein QJQ45_028336 [Haematococcus lacustris]
MMWLQGCDPLTLYWVLMESSASPQQPSADQAGHPAQPPAPPSAGPPPSQPPGPSLPPHWSTNLLPSRVGAPQPLMATSGAGRRSSTHILPPTADTAAITSRVKDAAAHRVSANGSASGSALPYTGSKPWWQKVPGWDAPLGIGGPPGGVHIPGTSQPVHLHHMLAGLGAPPPYPSPHQQQGVAEQRSWSPSAAAAAPAAGAQGLASGSEGAPGFDGYGNFTDGLGLRPPSPTPVGGLQPERAAALFRAYDLLGRGWLDRGQMVGALSEMGVAHGLGERGLNQVLNMDPQASREARYSLHDFLSMYERIGLWQHKVARDERIRALSVASQPPNWADSSPALRAVFSAYCRYATGTSRGQAAIATKRGASTGFEREAELRMNAAQLIKLCHDLDILGGDQPLLSFASVDMAFVKSKLPGGVRKLNYKQWLNALALLGDEAGRDLFSTIAGHVSTLHPDLVEQQAVKQQLAEARGAEGAGGQRARQQDGNTRGAPKAEASGGTENRSEAREGRVRQQQAAGSSDTVTSAPKLPPLALPNEASGDRASAGARSSLGARTSLTQLERAAEPGLAKQGSRDEGQPATGKTSGTGMVGRGRGGRGMADGLKAVGSSTTSLGLSSGSEVMDGIPGKMASNGGTAGIPHPRQAWGIAGAIPSEVSSAWESEQAVGSPMGANMRSPVARGGSNSRFSSPVRPATASPPGHFPPKVRDVESANVATEVWRFPSAMEQALAPVLTNIFGRLQVLEAREAERSIADAAMRADILIRSQRWEDSEKRTLTKASILEVRLTAAERHALEAERTAGAAREASQQAAQKIEEVATAVLPSTASQETDQRVAAAEQGLQAAEQRVQAVEGLVQAVQSQAQRQQLDAAMAVEKAEAAAAAVAALQEAVTPLQGQSSLQIEKLAQQVADLEKHLGDLAAATRESSEAHQTEVEALREDSAGVTLLLKQAVEAQEVQMAASQEASAAQREQLDAARAAMQKQVDEVKAAVDEALRQAHGALEEAQLRRSMSTHQSLRDRQSVSGAAELQARLDGFAITLEMVEGGISDRLDALTESTEKTAGALSALTARVAADSDASAGVQDSIATAILDLRSQVAKLEQAVIAASHSSPAVAEAQPPHPPDVGQGPSAVTVLLIKDELAAAKAELDSRLLALAEDLSGLQGQQQVAAQRLKELAAASGSHLTKDDLEDRLQQFRSDIVSSAMAAVSSRPSTRDGGISDPAAKAAIAALEGQTASCNARLASFEARVEQVHVLASGAAPRRVADEVDSLSTTVAHLRQEAADATVAAAHATSAATAAGHSAAAATARADAAGAKADSAAGTASAAAHAAAAAAAAAAGSSELTRVSRPSSATMPASGEDGSTVSGTTAIAMVEAKVLAACSELEGRLADSAASMDARFTSALQAVQAELQALDNRSKAGGPAMNSLAAELGAVHKKLAELEPAAAGMDAWQDRLQQKVNALEPVLSSLSSNLNSLTLRVDSLQPTVDTLASDVALALAKGSTTEARSEAFEQASKDATPDVSALATKLDALEVLVVGFGGRLSSVDVALSAVTAQAASSGQSVAAVEAALKPLQSVLEPLDARVVAVEASLASLSKEYPALLEAVAELRERPPSRSLSRSVSQLNAVGAMALRVTEMESRLDQMVEVVEALQASIKADEGQLGELKTAAAAAAAAAEASSLPPAVATELSKQQDQLDTLKRHLGEVAAAAAAAVQNATAKAANAVEAASQGAHSAVTETRLLGIERAVDDLRRGQLAGMEVSPDSIGGERSTSLSKMSDSGAGGMVRRSVRFPAPGGDPSQPADPDTLPASKQDLEVVSRKLQHLFTTVSQLQAGMTNSLGYKASSDGSKPSLDGQLQAGAEASEGGLGMGRSLSRPKSGVAVVTSVGGSVANAQMAALQAALQNSQAQMMQQLQITQGAVAQLNAKVNSLEVKGGSGPVLQEADKQRTEQQMALLQGALVQLNGEVNQLKIAVPQLMSAIKDASSGLDAAQVTANVAAGQYGPVLAALAEELQRTSVRSEVVERDVRVALASYARATDVSQLDVTLAARMSALDEEVEGLRDAVRTAVETANAALNGSGVNSSLSGANRAMTRTQTARAPSAGIRASNTGLAAESSTGDVNHRYASWDALKHSETMLIKEQQHTKQEIIKLDNAVHDVEQRIKLLAEKLGSQLESREKRSSRNEIEAKRAGPANVKYFVNVKRQVQVKGRQTSSTSQGPANVKYVKYK